MRRLIEDMLDVSRIRTGKLSVNLDAKTVDVDGARVHLIA